MTIQVKSNEIQQDRLIKTLAKPSKSKFVKFFLANLSKTSEASTGPNVCVVTTSCALKGERLQPTNSLELAPTPE